MNTQFGMCPQCKMEISEERLRESLVICQHCGFSDQKSMQKLEKNIFKSFLTKSLVATVFMVGGFIQSVSWGEYATTIIPLKIKDVAGMATASDYKEIAKICTARMKWECAESALLAQYQKSPHTELEALANLGKLQFKQGRYALAAQNLGNYFNYGGLDLEASYDYARALSQQGQVYQASQVYGQILKAKPETLQITVAQNYVKLLMNNNRFGEAKDVLEEIRNSGANASLFMDKEFQEIKTRVK